MTRIHTGRFTYGICLFVVLPDTIKRVLYEKGTGRHEKCFVLIIKVATADNIHTKRYHPYYGNQKNLSKSKSK